MNKKIKKDGFTLIELLVVVTLVSIIEAVYVIYILNFYKTKYSFAHPLTYFENKILYHPIGKSSEPISNICKLGNIGAFFIAAYIILRIFYKNEFSVLNKLVVFIVFVMSLLNFNAVIYLLPYFCIEYLVITKKLK